MENNFAALKSPDARPAEPVKVAPVQPSPETNIPPIEGGNEQGASPDTSTQNTAAVAGSEVPGAAAPMAPADTASTQSAAATTGPASTDPNLVDVTGDIPREILSQRETEIITERAAREATANLLRDLGIESVDKLREKLIPPKQLTPEEQKRQDDIFKMSVQDFGVKELGYSPEDFTKVERAAAMTDEQLVFDTFKNRWIEQNKANINFNGKDLEQEARYEFDQLFHLSSDDERIKSLGLNSLQESAKSIREQMQGLYTNAEKQYREVSQLKAQVIPFKSIIQSTIRNAPKELVYEIDGDRKVTYQLDKLDRQALENELASDANFNYFLQKGGPEAAAVLDAQMHEYIYKRHHKEIVQAAIRTSLDTGVKQATIGAKAPFGMPPPAAPTQAQNKVSREDDARISSLLGPGNI